MPTNNVAFEVSQRFNPICEKVCAKKNDQQSSKKDTDHAKNKISNSHNKSSLLATPFVFNIFYSMESILSSANPKSIAYDFNRTAVLFVGENNGKALNFDAKTRFCLRHIINIVSICIRERHFLTFITFILDNGKDFLLPFYYFCIPAAHPIKIGLSTI